MNSQPTPTPTPTPARATAPALARALAGALVLAWLPPGLDGAAERDLLAGCARQAEVTQRIPLTTGVYTEQAQVAVPNDIELRFYLDEAAFAECLRREGGSNEADRAAWFARLDSCRDGRRQARAVIGQGASPHLTGSGTAEEFAACLRGEGPAPGELDVEVEVGR